MYRKLKGIHWKPPQGWARITTMDMHTGGEPLRILTDGYPRIEGATILAKQKYFRENFDHIRKGIIWEPRGHTDMYGAVITEPCSGDGDFGTFFLNNEGYSSMCGHAIIALTKFVLDTKLIKKRGDTVSLRIDAPPGRIVSTARRQDGEVIAVSFRNVPSFVLYSDQHVQVPGLGRVQYDVAFGGAFYVIVDAEKYKLSLDASEYNHLVELGMRIKKIVANNRKIVHPYHDELGFLYGTIFTGNASHPSRHSRNVCVFANGEVDRSATGSGVSARAALHYMRGEMKMGDKMVIESILGSALEVELSGLTTFGPHKAILPVVSGSAFFTGKSQYWFDPGDPMKDGFIFR